MLTKGYTVPHCLSVNNTQRISQQTKTKKIPYRYYLTRNVNTSLTLFEMLDF